MRFNFENRGGGETGRMYEAKVLGVYKMTPQFIEAEAMIKKNRRGHYQEDEDLYRVLKENVTGDPTNPEVQHARDIRLAVIESLGIENLEEEDAVKYYTAVGTPLDVKMGVDAFIEFTDPETHKTSRATIDVTLNTRKLNESYGKADIVIGELPDAIIEEDEYLEMIDEYGKQIAEKLKLQSNEINRGLLH